MQSYRTGESVTVDGQPAQVVSDFGSELVCVRMVLVNGMVDSQRTSLVSRERVARKES